MSDLKNHQNFMTQTLMREMMTPAMLVPVIASLVQRVPALARTKQESDFLAAYQSAQEKAQRIAGAKNNSELATANND